MTAVTLCVPPVRPVTASARVPALDWRPVRGNRALGKAPAPGTIERMNTGEDVMIELFQATRTARAALALFLVLAAASSPAARLASGELAKPAFPVAGIDVRHLDVRHLGVVHLAARAAPIGHPGAAAKRRALLERIGGTADARELLDIERRLSDLETHSGR